MKRILAITLAAILLLASCNMEGPRDKIVTVALYAGSQEASKSLSVSQKVELESYTWTYSVKAVSGLGWSSVEQNHEYELESGTAIQLSIGTWEFTVNGYRTKDGTTYKVLSGSITNRIEAGTKSVSVPVSLQIDGNVNGFFESTAILKINGQPVNLEGCTYKWQYRANGETSWTDMTNAIPAGTYLVRMLYVKDSTAVYSTDEKTVTINNGILTSITGDVDAATEEQHSNVFFLADGISTYRLYLTREEAARQWYTLPTTKTSYEWKLGSSTDVLSTTVFSLAPVTGDESKVEASVICEYQNEDTSKATASVLVTIDNEVDYNKCGNKYLLGFADVKTN